MVCRDRLKLLKRFQVTSQKLAKLSGRLGDTVGSPEFAEVFLEVTEVMEDCHVAKEDFDNHVRHHGCIEKEQQSNNKTGPPPH